MRRLIAFACEGQTLLGSLDAGSGTTGLLIVSGGNEIRIGAHRGMAQLATRLAAAGTPVFRFDRRGIGDSEGENGGFETSGPDIAAALAAFRAEAPALTRIIGFGNCDAATALALYGDQLDGLILANPWIIERNDDLPPAAAIRARYADRVRDPKAWLRLVRGGVNIDKLLKGLSKLSSAKSDTKLGTRLAAALNRHNKPLTIILARGDNTAIAFAETWPSPIFAHSRNRARLVEVDTASHSFVHAQDKDALFLAIRQALDCA